jgi:predicted metal-dependent hydrolase
MKETLLLIVFIITFYIVFILNNDKSLIEMNTNDSTMPVYVRESPNMEQSAKLLSDLINRMYKLRDYLVENIKDYPKYSEYIEQMEDNFNNRRTKIYETSLNSNYTSYSINKGEELVFCLRCKKTYMLHDVNLLMYVAVHEMAHTACPETGHTPLFNDIFKFMLNEAIKLKLYYYENYSENPVEYCGMRLYTNILN